jgi:hypothetical protein
MANMMKREAQALCGAGYVIMPSPILSIFSEVALAHALKPTGQAPVRFRLNPRAGLSNGCGGEVTMTFVTDVRAEETRRQAGSYTVDSMRATAR